MLQHAYQTQFVQNPAKNDLQSNSAAKSMKLEELYLNKKISFFRGRKEKEGRNYKNKRCKRGGYIMLIKLIFSILLVLS